MNFRITVKQNPLEVEFDSGSISEAISILEQQSTALGALFQLAADSLTVSSDTTGDTSTGADNAAPATTKGRPGRKSNAQKAAEAAAAEAAKAAAPPAPLAPPTPAPALQVQAPAPLAVPGAAPAPVYPTPGDKVEIPQFLNRAADAAPPPPAPAPAPLAPPPAPAPAAPQPANNTPPQSVLAPKIIENLKARVVSAGDGGKSLVDWLVTNGIVMAGGSFEEALSVVQFCRDEQLAPIAAALGVA
jgi:hypothetical protein